MQPASVTSHQYAGDRIAKSCEVAGVYKEGTLNDMFIEEDDQTLRYNLRNYWATSSQACLADIEF